MNFQIWYMRPEWFREGICGEKPDPTNLDATHVFLTSIAIKASHNRADWTLQEVYHRMQGDVWSPNGEARQLMREPVRRAPSALREGPVAPRCACGAYACFAWGPPLVQLEAWFCPDHKPADYFTRGHG